MPPPNTCNRGASFTWRAMVSVMVSISFTVLIMSGAMLFVSPPGRIANWTNWGILGLTKKEWIEVHVCFALVFMIVSILHLVLNWRPLVSYFKNRLTHRFGFRREWLLALAICGLVYGGTRLGMPPFSTWLAFNERVKESWDDPRVRAPIPHAELLTLADLAQKAGVDLTTVTNRLQARGIIGYSPDIKVQQLADNNRLSARQIYELLMDEPNGNRIGRGQGQGHGGGGQGGGMGFKTLTQFCADEGISLTNALTRLQDKGLKASPDQTLREIAVNNGFSRPYEIVELLQAK